MKTIRLIIAGLVMTMGFSSCSSLFYDAKVDVLNSIQTVSYTHLTLPTNREV